MQLSELSFPLTWIHYHLFSSAEMQLQYCQYGQKSYKTDQGQKDWLDTEHSNSAGLAGGWSAVLQSKARSQHLYLYLPDTWTKEVSCLQNTALALQSRYYPTLRMCLNFSTMSRTKKLMCHITEPSRGEQGQGLTNWQLCGFFSIIISAVHIIIHFGPKMYIPLKYWLWFSFSINRLLAGSLKGQAKKLNLFQFQINLQDK